MLKLLRRLRFWKSAETVDTAASLWDRFLPSPRDVLAWAVTVLTSVGVGWWGAVQSALPFGIGLGIVMVVALRAAWLNEETRRVSGIGLAHPDRATLAGPGRQGAAEPAFPVDTEARTAQAAPADGADASAPAPPKVAPERLAGTVAEQLLKQLASAEARLEEEIAGVEARAKERSDLAHACIVRLRDEVFGILRARDDERELRRLDDEAAALFRSLHQADLSKYRNDNAWLADYSKWKSAITRFWDILRGYSESVGQPFQFTDTDLDGRIDVPDKSLFAADDMRHTYRFMLVANDRHTELRRNAFQFMAEKGKPPRTTRESG